MAYLFVCILFPALFSSVFDLHRSTGVIYQTTYSDADCTYQYWETSEVYRLNKCTCGLDSCFQVVQLDSSGSDEYVVETYNTVDDCRGDPTQFETPWGEMSWEWDTCNPNWAPDPNNTALSTVYRNRRYYSTWGYYYNAYRHIYPLDTYAFSATTHYVGDSCKGTVYSSMAIRTDPRCQFPTVGNGIGDCVYDSVTGLSGIALCGEMMWPSWPTTQVAIFLGISLGIFIPAITALVVLCLCCCCYYNRNFRGNNAARIIAAPIRGVRTSVVPMGVVVPMGGGGVAVAPMSTAASVVAPMAVAPAPRASVVVAPPMGVAPIGDAVVAPMSVPPQAVDVTTTETDAIDYHQEQYEI